MSRKERFLRAVIRGLLAHPWLVLAVAFATAAAAGWRAIGLRVDADLVNLLPRDHPAVAAIERLKSTVGGETYAAVLIEAPEPAAARAFAEALIPRAEALRQENGEPVFTRIDYRAEVAAVERVALYLATDVELDQLEGFLDERAGAARLAANPLHVDLLEEDEEDAEAAAASRRRAEELKSLQASVIPREYPVSDDGKTLVLRMAIAGSKSDYAFVDRVYDGLAGIVAELGPSRFHPDLRVDLGGPLIRQKMELEAINRDVRGSFLAGVASVLGLVTAYFGWKAARARAGTAPWWRIALGEVVRLPITALILGLPMTMAVAWTFGFAALCYGSLNLMTATLGLVLFGLGIDFAIHFYGRYAEERGHGFAVGQAIERTFVASAEPITVTGLTTAISFGILIIAQFRGFSEFGAIIAVGINFAGVAMLLVLPVLVAQLERTGLLHLGYREEPGLPAAARAGHRFPYAPLVIAVCLIATGVAFLRARQLPFEYDFDRLEPRFAAYDRLRDIYGRVYSGRGRNPAYVIAEKPFEVPAIVHALRERAARDPTPTILRVEALQDRLPLARDEQQRKLARIAAIRGKLDDPFLRQDESDEMQRLRRAAALNTAPALADLPPSLRREFTAKDGSLGSFVIVYPSVGLNDGRKSMQFADDVAEVHTSGQTYHAASTSLVAAAMLRMLMREIGLLVALAALALVVLIPLSFRSLPWSVIALSPVTLGVVWMLGAMASYDLSLNFYNLVALPAVIGMGEDAGVHIAHRYREEGRGSLGLVLRSTGEHTLMCALTNAMGFSGMLFSFHPGLRSLGMAAVIGLLTTVLASLLFLPALLQVLEPWLFPRREAQPGAATAAADASR